MYKMPNVNGAEVGTYVFFWLVFIVGMGMWFGTGAALVAFSFPIVLSGCFDRIRIAIYSGKEVDD